jgi:hypothetical protein
MKIAECEMLIEEIFKIREIMNKDEELESCQKIIRKLIFSNMQKGAKYELFIYFGPFKIIYHGKADDTLDMPENYFLEQIALLTNDKKEPKVKI